MNLHIGQKVVCVDASPPSACHSDAPGPFVTRGVIYTVRGFSESDFGTIGILLEEIVQPYYCCWNGNEVGWRPCRFRPIKTTDISIFTKMLAPTPKEREAA